MYRWLLTAAAVSYGAVIGAAQAETTTLRLASFVSPKSVSASRVLIPISRSIEKDSGGTLKLKGYYGGTLGRSPLKQYKLLTDGVADAAYLLELYASGQFPDNSLFELPYNIRTATEGSLARWEMFNAGHLRGYQDIKVMGVWMSDPGGIHTRKPMSSLADIKGMKIRATGKVATAFLKQFGAVPVAMSVTKVTEAIDRGVLDGLMQSWVGLVTFRTHNVVKYHYEAPVGALTFLIGLNKKKWNKLSAPHKALIDKYGGAYMAAKAGAAFDKLGKERLAKHRNDADRKFTIPTETQLLKARAAAQPIYDEWLAGTPNGREKLDALNKILAKHRSKK